MSGPSLPCLRSSPSNDRLAHWLFHLWRLVMRAVFLLLMLSLREKKGGQATLFAGLTEPTASKKNMVSGIVFPISCFGPHRL